MFVYVPQHQKLYLLTSSICSEMIGQWSDRSAMSDRKTLSPPGPMSYLCGLALRIWTSFWRKEDSDGMDMWNATMVQSRQPLTYRLMESVGLGGPRWHGNSWQRGIAESGSSRPSALMIDIPGDLVWDLLCMQQVSYLEGGPLWWMLPLYLHINQKSDYDMIWWHVPSKDTDQSAHLCSPVRIFTGHILDTLGCKVSSFGQQRLQSDCADVHVRRYSFAGYSSYAVCV